MHFNRHSDLEGKHAVLSASKYHWINYTDDKFDDTYRTRIAAALGTELHEFAHFCIRLKQKLSGSKKTLNMYVNDAIGFRMTSEQILYYSPNSFGTADALSFRDMFLRIHDLKTGVNPASFKQLEVYVALFCLEYGYKPVDIKIELRIYQNDEVLKYTPDPDDITHIMDRIITLDQRIEDIKEQELG